MDDTPKPEPLQRSDNQEPLPPVPAPKPIATNGTSQHLPTRAAQPAPSAPSTPVPEEPDSDDPSLPIAPNTTCRRRGCNGVSTSDTKTSREGEKCLYHPGQALFHEGSKGWTCCKRRVLEFDEFMKIEGCEHKSKHVFVGSKKDSTKEEKVSDVR